MEKKILDVTCGSRTIWFDKAHPAAVYCDIRNESYSAIWKSTKNDSERQCVIAPDVQCDFTCLPFADGTFSLVVFDPPHLKHVGENAWLRKKYGALGEGWQSMLHDGKDKEVWVRGYGKNGADISLFDLLRDLTRWNCPYVDLDISDDSFSMMMAEWLWEDVESFEHVLALLYQAAWVCAELREHLKQFEDKENDNGKTDI